MKELIRQLKENKKEEKKYVETARKQGKPLEKTEIEEVNVTGNFSFVDTELSSLYAL